MSGYSGQEAPLSVRSNKPPHKRIIESGAAKCLLEQAIGNTKGAEATFIIEASRDKWKIDFPRTESGLVLDYDEIVGEMWQQLESDIVVKQAYGWLVAQSLEIDLIGDSK